MKQYVDRPNGEPARRQACRSDVSVVAVEAFVNYAGIRCEIVDSRTATISTQEDKRQLILVTCYPFHAIVPGGRLCYMVIAETVERMAED